MDAPVDDVWEAMKQAEKLKIKEYKKKVESLAVDDTVESLIRKSEKAKAAKAKAEKEKSVPVEKEKAKVKRQAKSATAAAAVEPAVVDTSELVSYSAPVVVQHISFQDLWLKVARDMDGLSSENSSVRRSAVTKLYKALFVENSMSAADYSMFFRDYCKPFFKLFADPIEKCREQAAIIVAEFFNRATDFVPILGYFLPCVMQRLPTGLAFDEEMKVFVADLEVHEAYRRGRAVDRQDKTGVVGAPTHTVIESSEEIRLLVARAVSALIRRTTSMNASSILHPYFHEIIIFFQYHLSDPYPELKMESCATLELLAEVPDFEGGMKFFAVGLVRAILPVLRHRHAKVRLPAVDALRACMVVPDRAKMKGSGTEAIPDLVGFREENVLQVSAFYKIDVQFNYLAELVQDKSVAVKEAVVRMLTVFLTEIGDRYDHQTRLIPYLLDLLTDEAESVSSLAMQCLQKCGKQYEEEHQDEIIERRQYGVDGDQRINIEKPLPRPFKERPRLGVRLYIRGNTKRFISALVAELTNWQAQTRLKSCELLKIVVIGCEEHLTIEAHTMLPAYVKAISYAKDDGDKDLQKALFDLFELVGRFTLPDTYVHFILPRLKGDPEVVQFGVDTPTRESVLELLRSLISGSKLSQLLPYFEDIIDAVTDPFVIDRQSIRLKAATVELLTELLCSTRGKGKALIEAHFMTTGRLGSLNGTLQKLFRFLLEMIGDPTLNQKTSLCLMHLSELQADIGLSQHNRLGQLFSQHTLTVVDSLIESYDLDETWSSAYSEHRVLSAVCHCPWPVLYSNLSILPKLIDLISTIASNAQSAMISSTQRAEVLAELSQMLTHILSPLTDINCRLPASLEYKEILKEAGEGQSFWKTIYTAEVATSVKDRARENLHQRSCILEAGSLLNRVVTQFLLHNIWSTTPHLQVSRLNLLSALLFTSREEEDEENDPDSGAELESGDYPLLYYGGVIDGTAHCSAASALYFVTTGTSHASNPKAIRIRGARLLLKAMRMLDVWTVDGVTRVKSFKKQRELAVAARAPSSCFSFASPSSSSSSSSSSSTSTSSSSTIGTVGVKDGTTREFLLRDRRAVELCVKVALDLLDDSCDEVRFVVVEILSAVVVAGLIEDDSSSSSSSSQGSQLGFSVIVNRLLRESVSVCRSGDVGSFGLKDSLDCLLKDLAVLDPARMEALARQILVPPTPTATDSTVTVTADAVADAVVEKDASVRPVGTALSNEAVSQLVNDLIAHCDILSQFA